MTDRQIIYGWHAVNAIMERNPAAVDHLLLSTGDDRRIQELLASAAASGIKTESRPRSEIDRLYPDATHQGVVATLKSSNRMLTGKQLPAFLDTLSAPALLLVLDGVQDPHNLGACLRTADAAGVQAVIVPRDRAAGLTPVVHKVACGATQSVPVFAVTNLARTLRLLKEAGIWLYGASDKAPQALYETDLSGPLALVLGSEGSGLRRLTAELCDFQVAIPMAGVVESLNVSVAAGVLLYEVRRQRLQASKD
ncbi:MAG: 23S rRNA (guanosine(2251)-2'-O)-methyltransferase RlmB [Gammaproteobacteria bacterium]|nr:23S rRNA (guanosine(2251)-2'-O)-methyltransferase RlmB [Gammaproteobacteria bacterium]